MIMSNIGAAIMDVISNPLVASVAPGGTARAKVTWTITGTQSHTYHVLSLLGNYNTGTGEFSAWGYKDMAVTGFSQSRQDNLDVTVPTTGVPAGTYDGLVIVCDNFDPSSGTITNIYDSKLTMGAIQVSGGTGNYGAQITSVDYIAV